VHEPVLVHALIDEGAEGRDVGHHALELHAVLEIGDALDTRGDVSSGPLRLDQVTKRADAHSIQAGSRARDASLDLAAKKASPIVP
jgi:hypothetical protein